MFGPVTDVGGHSSVAVRTYLEATTASYSFTFSFEGFVTMKTFEATLKEVKRLKGRSVVLRHLADVLENDFLSPSDAMPPKHLLLTDEKIPVDSETIDEVVADLLNEDSEIKQKLTEINQSTLTPAPK